jgi:TonB-linked outer membrane protein, SusC/RagA family
MASIQCEVTPLLNDDLFVLLNNIQAKFDYPVHFHSDYELNLVLNTSGKRIVGDSVENFENTDLVLLGPGLPHKWKAPTNDNTQVITIQFQDELYDSFLMNKRVCQPIKELLARSTRGIVFSGNTFNTTKEKLFVLSTARGFNTMLDFYSILYSLAISADQRLLTSATYDSTLLVTESRSRRIEKICRYIEQNYMHEITLADVASLVNMMGMKDVEVTFTGQEQIMVEMQMNSDELEATVVTGIFTRKKDSYTGAVQTVTSDEIKRVGNQNVLQSLKSIDPSLLVVANLQEGSNPNSIASMQLRGASSFNMESTTSLKSNFVSDVNQPLFILDGFETTVEKIQDMDMNRVESITILKDASAKAIYGSKAGNGVIVIETKSLRNDQTAVTYTGSCDIEIPDLSSYNLCNALEKLEIERREGFYSLSSATPAELQNISDLYSERYRRALAGESTYWLSKPLRLGIGQKHSLSIELGSKDLKSITDISYNNTQGTMKGSFRKVLSGDMNLSYRRGNWTFRNIMSIANMNNSDSPYGTFDTYASLNPYYNPYDEEGNLVSGFNSGDDALVMYKSASAHSLQGYVGNPLYDATLNLKLTSEYLNFTNNTYIEWQVAKPIKIVGRFGINTQKTGSEEFYPAAHSRFKTLSSSYYGKDGTYEMSDGYYNSYSGDVSAQFNHKFTEDHSLFATAQYSISQTSYGEVTNYAEGFPNSHMNSIIFAREYASDHTPTGAYGLNRNLGILLTSGYSYKDKYMLDATIKASASSVFGTNNRWGTFWSAGIAWNAHKEDFLKDMAGNWLEQLKFRFSLGSSGNQNYTTNNSLPVYQYSNYYYNGFTGAMLQNMENPYLGWEQKMDYNLGADIKTKQVTFTVDAYISDTDNLVFSRSILPSTGFTSVSDNLGKVRNKGIEAGGSWTIIQKGTSYLSIFAKVIFNDNRILQISDALRNYNQQQQEQAESSKSTTPVIQYYDGAPLNSIWAVQSLGIDPKTGKEIFLDKDGNMHSDDFQSYSDWQIAWGEGTKPGTTPTILETLIVL